MADNLTLGIDLGGTKILAVIVDSAGAIVARAKADTPQGKSLEEIAERLRTVAAEALKSASVDWKNIKDVGIAVPSSVDPATGVVLHSPALGWKNLPAREVIQKVFGRPVVLDNDVNCGVLAEALLGAGKGCACVGGYFVGTGTGGGVVINGKLHRGKRGAAGEFGHEIVRANGRKCGCGHRGCLEAYCSKTAFARRFDKLIIHGGQKSLLPELAGSSDFTRNLKSRAIAKAYRKGDAVVCTVVNKGAIMLGIAVANLMATLAPDCIVLGGGIMEAMGDELLPKVRASAEEHLFGLGKDDLNLVLSKLADDAVPLGASLLPRAG